MPVITFEISKLTKDQKIVLAKEFTEVAQKVTGIPQELFYVILKENETDNVGVGGVLLSER